MFPKIKMGVWGYVRGFSSFKKPTFVIKRRGFVSKQVDIVVIWLLSLDSLKILKRNIHIFKKQLSLSFHFLF